MAYSRRPLLSCALLLTLATTACGLAGGSAQRKPSTQVPPLPKSSGSATPAPNGSGTPAKPGSSADGTGGTPKPGTSATAATNGTPKPGTPGTPAGTAKPAKPVTDLKLVVALSKNCLLPGQSQTVTVDVNLPKAVVLIDTLYEDKKDGQTHGGFKMDGQADAKGHYTYTFTVLPGTPSGAATVFVRAGNREHRGEGQKGFIVGTTC